MAAEVRKDFARLLIVDEILTGLAYFREDGRIDYLLHPGDRTTGVSYSLLPMIHAIISDLLTPKQAENHLRLIKAHLLGPDGARLFDRPLEYRGGPQHYFQRAETASFFRSEIGLMYTMPTSVTRKLWRRYAMRRGFFWLCARRNPSASARWCLPQPCARQIVITPAPMPLFRSLPGVYRI